TCLDAGEEKGVPYIVLEHAGGSDLAAHGGTAGVACLEDGIAWAAQLCEALEHLHGLGIVHGDLKAQHALVHGSGRIVLVDFGTAAGDPAVDGVEGSAAYLAPEVRAGAPRSAASDCYALGVILVRLFSGRLPFEGPGDLEFA